MKYDQKNLKYHITIGLLTVLCILFGYLYVGSSIKSNDLRGQVSSVREQLDRETETNRQLRAELESSQSRLKQCHFILEEFRETTDRDISTIRDCIEIIEETRETIGYLSYYIDDCNSSDIYDRLDSWLETEGVYPVK
jgi:uncharacterized coiled-coil DUF342 family protein